MFAVVEIEEVENTLKNRLKAIFNPPAATVERVEIPNSFSFYKVKIQAMGEAVPWGVVAEAAGSLKARLILPQDIKLDESLGLKRYEPTVFPLHVLFNSAVSTLRTMALDPARMCVSVVDENAFLLEKISSLVPLASTIRIVTKNFFYYEKLAERLMNKFGISLIISGSVDEGLFSSTVIISDSAAQIPALFGGILFSNQGRRMMNATVLTGEGITLPPKYEALLPKGVDRLTFASAMYELCAANELEAIPFDKISIFSGRQTDIFPKS